MSFEILNDYGPGVEVSKIQLTEPYTEPVDLKFLQRYTVIIRSYKLSVTNFSFSPFFSFRNFTEN